VVEVQVAVGHLGHLVEAYAVLRQGIDERPPARAVVRIDLRVRTHPRVEEEEPLGMRDEVAEARLDDGQPRAGLLAGPDEPAEVEASDIEVTHHPSIGPQALSAR